jgi:hypothetical protein
MARRTLLLIAAGLLATAGCVGTAQPPPPPPPPPPPRPTQVCGVGFDSPGSYQGAFNALSHGNTGWVTADGFAPVQTSGRTAWWMADTTTGTAHPNGSVSDRGNVHNSVVWQEGDCLRPQFDLIPQTGNVYHWPGSAVVSGNQMLVFSFRVFGCASEFGFCVDGAAFTRFSLPSLQRIEGPTPMPLNHAENGGEAVPWGVRSILADGKVYLYGTTKFTADSPFGPIPVAEAWLARAPFNNPLQLEYFTKPVAVTPATPEWSTDFGNAMPMSFTENLVEKSSPLAQLSVVPYEGGFLAGAFAADVFKDGQGRSFVRAWTSNSPQGPWQMVMNGTNPQNVAIFDDRTSEQIAYDARIPNLPPFGSTVVYSVNDQQGQFIDFTLYRGEFDAPVGLP